MVTTDEQGVTRAIKDIIARSMEPEPGDGSEPGHAFLDALLERMTAIHKRLATRLPGMPTDEELRNHLSTLDPATLRTLQESGAWDTLIVGGEEADIDLFYQSDSPVYVPLAPPTRESGRRPARRRIPCPPTRSEAGQDIPRRGQHGSSLFLEKRSRVLRSGTGHDHDGGKGRTSITLVAYVWGWSWIVRSRKCMA